MANKDNECSNLVNNYEDKHKDSIDTLGDLINLQANTQKHVFKYDFKSMTLAELMTFWHMNNHAMIDEIHEATDALGGIKDGSGSAIWKKWKKDHESFKDKKFSDLTDSDQLECKFEIIDILHFAFNYAISIGMTPKEVFNLYMLKNKENVNRQKRGY